MCMYRRRNGGSWTQKAEKCILVGYSDEQKGYKCYNPRTKQARVSRDVVFDESASWYLPPDSNLSSDDEVSEAEMPPDEPEIETESPISLRLSGPNGRLSRYDQSNEEPASSGDSVVHSPRRKPEKGKRKVQGEREEESVGIRHGQERVRPTRVRLRGNW